MPLLLQQPQRHLGCMSQALTRMPLLLHSLLLLLPQRQLVRCHGSALQGRCLLVGLLSKLLLLLPLLLPLAVAASVASGCGGWALLGRHCCCCCRWRSLHCLV